jgi:hypothetical protein
MSVPLDRDEILELNAAGFSYGEIAKIKGVGKSSIFRCVKVPPSLNLDGIAKMGPGVVQWYEDHKEETSAMRDRMCDSGAWNQPSIGTVVLLALAEQVHGELVQQTGGVAPTMRSALYRMMGVYGASKDVYGPLAAHTATARKADVLPRDFWTDADPLTNGFPGWYTAESALRGRLRELARPPTALRDTGIVIGVVVEAAGQASGLEGALKRRLDYGLPVWPPGGLGSLPRYDYVTNQMLRWADQNDADEATLLVVTDFDPTGLVIAHEVEEQVHATGPEVEVVRLGMDPVVAAQRNAVIVPPTGETFSEKHPHARSRSWLDACAEHGTDPTMKDECFQAEALDYTTWADVIGDAVDERLIGRRAVSGIPLPDFGNGDRILAAIGRMVDESESLETLADELEES